MNPLAPYPMAITAAVLVPVIMWLTTWPIHPPTEAQAASLAVLILAVIGALHAWLGGHLQPNAMIAMGQQAQDQTVDPAPGRTPDHPPELAAAIALAKDAKAQRLP